MTQPPSLFRDPWAKSDAWRKHPVFAKRAMLSSMFPGFGIAVVAFTAFVVAEKVYLSSKPEQDAHHH
ncbi:hypothetical protein JAAARDRAFT_177621 [Jaapia argillacea MUCL 33604]|uniref:NADH dehydrogenase 1 beta subcomplex subunit 3 n=1 Tax=Jaapia argillacea MUCL 33604 TaxID=933084 RepID=A0A067PRL8_9AGAM|nr:hypothetical protein JAAARDRAFT_177621 [Jaapia argillacea MUCL 33604]